MHNLPVHALAHPLQAMSSSGLDCQSARCPKYCPAKQGRLGADDTEDVEASTEVDEGLTKEMEML